MGEISIIKANGKCNLCRHCRFATRYTVATGATCSGRVVAAVSESGSRENEIRIPRIYISPVDMIIN